MSSPAGPGEQRDAVFSLLGLLLAKPQSTHMQILGCGSSVGKPGHVGHAKSKPVGRGGSLPAEAGLLSCVPQTFSTLPNISFLLQSSKKAFF